MTRLFRTSPHLQKESREYLEKILEIYWSVPSFLDWDFRRSSKLENRFLQCIRGAKGDSSCLDQHYASRMTQLKEFHDCNTLYERVYRLMVKLKKIKRQYMEFVKLYKVNQEAVKKAMRM